MRVRPTVQPAASTPSKRARGSREYPDRTGGLGRALEIVGERWTLLIVRDVMGGTTRFDELHAGLGLSRKVLALRLEMLVRRGIMTRVPYQDRPVRCDYRLTPAGRALSRALEELGAWGDAYARANASGEHAVADGEGEKRRAAVKLRC